MEFKNETDIKIVAKFVANKIIDKLKSGRTVLWFVPGGSAIAVAAETSRIIAKFSHSNLSVTLTDERYGPPGHQDSNWQGLLDAGLRLPEAKLIQVLTGENIINTTSKFNDILKQELDGTNYRIGLFGIGENGHTAGIMPGSVAVSDEHLACWYKAEKFDRITLTSKAIQRIDEVIVFAKGEAKWKTLQDLEGEEDVTKQPAQILKRVPLLTIFTDYKKDL
ncbi:hypothetical protein A3I95_02550 [Candidatus Nomurabacteria bacterium RIFCSPLOWO2_02_FULL_44_12]|nr:MAG: hypothetical protein A3I95_02550 [Candidatus Nomurabacteria bacterium RIFCSPLOWO2_02_FULL_44_12]